MRLRHFAAIACAFVLAGCSSQTGDVEVPAPTSGIVQSDSLDGALKSAKIDSSGNTFRIRFNLKLDDGRTADTEISLSLQSLLRYPARGMFLVPGSIAPLEIYDNNVAGFDAGDILAHDGFFVATVNLPGVGSSSGPSNGSAVTAAFLGDFYLRALKAVNNLLPIVGKWDVYGEEGTGGNAILQLAEHPEIVRTASSGAQIYHVLTPLGAAEVLGPDQLALLNSFPSGYFSVPPPLYGAFLQFSTTAFQTAACGGVGCPGPSGFLYQYQPYPEGIFYEAIADFPTTGYIIRANGAKVPGFFQQGAGDFLAAAPDDVNALVSDYGSVGGGTATGNVCSGGFHFVRTDSGSGNGATSCFWTHEFAFLDSH